MKTIMQTYPDYHSLPKGIKRMLVTSESLFFEEAKNVPTMLPESGARKGVFPMGALPTAYLTKAKRAWSPTPG